MSKLEVVRLDLSKNLLVEKIVALRKSEYSKRFNPSINLNQLDWNFVDSSSDHYGIVYDSKLLSALRLSIHQKPEDLEICTKISTPKNVKFPVALLSRAATLSEFQSFGLHSMIRALALSQCLKMNIHCALGSLEVSSMRFKQLQLLGYRVLATDSSWKNSSIPSKGPVALVGLVGERSIKNAIEKLESRFSSTHLFFTNQHRSLE